MDLESRYLNVDKSKTVNIVCIQTDVIVPHRLVIA